MLETFVNPGQGFCIVIERRGSSALILIKNNNRTPFVVAIDYQKGGVSWNWGSYFSTLKEAVDYWEGLVIR